MKRPLFHTLSYSAQVTRKRRYSSTAVGFPIRNDQKADCQRVSRGFPTWERARRAGTYVKEPRLCVCRAYIPLHYSKTITTTLLMVYTTPLVMQQTNTMARPHKLIAMSLGEPKNERTSPLVPLMMLLTTTMARPHIRIAMSLGESESERTNHSKTNWSSLAVHLGVTCSRHRHGVYKHSVLSVNLLSLFVVCS